MEKLNQNDVFKNFLLLASHSFASILGYGSFEKFLDNTFYLEANLTTDKILYVHLDKTGMVDEHSNYISKNYSATIHDIIFETIVDESQKEIDEFFSRERLLNEYNQGKSFSEKEFLHRSDEGKNTRWLHAVCQMNKSSEENEVRAFFLIFDIDSYHRMNDEMIALVERDTMTGLYNRRTAVRMTKSFLLNKDMLAFVIVDLDNFKQINDRFGHDCGDMIIKDIAARMKENFADKGIVARLGGDEFLAVLKNLSSEEIDCHLKNFSSIHKSIEYKGEQVYYTVSIGYSVFPEQGINYKELYQNADMALYSVKMAGRNSYEKFSIKMLANNRAQLGVSLSQISEGMPGGFLLYKNDEAQEILYANKRLWKIYECESLEEFRKFTGNSFRGCVHPDDWDKVQKTIYEQVGVFEGYDYVRYRVNTAKGNIKIIEDFGRLIQSEGDEEVFYVFMIDFVEKEKLWDFVKTQNIN